MSLEDSDPDLVDRAVRGDPVALKLLLTESHERLCRRIARRMPPDVAPVIGAEDIAQETHVEVFRRIGRFVPRDEGSFSRWLAAIALSRLRNAIQYERAAKRCGRQLRIGDLPPNREDSHVALLDLLAGPGQTPSRCVAGTEARQAVQEAMQQIPEHYRHAIWLVYLEGRPVIEAASMMGRTERAVHGLCRRGLVLLRNELGSAGRFLSSTR